MKYFKIITLGCKVNQYESAFIEEALKNKECRKINEEDKADLIIINTCIVTARASQQSRQAIRSAIRDNPDAVIAVVGCYGQVFPEEVSEIKGVDIIAGNKGKGSLPERLMGASLHDTPLILREDFEELISFEQIPIKRFSDRTRAFLKIQDGCESFCSYCIVPMARGPLRSLEPDKILEMLKGLEGEGYKEVVLTGIHLGQYGLDFKNGINLTELLKNIAGNRGSLRIRLGSLEPTEIGEELIELMAGDNWLCRHFHISLQSGDDEVLKRMNRHYTAGMFSKAINDICRLVPQVSIGVDVLVGFPGEDDRAFNNTLGLLNDLPVSYFHVFPYSKRKGTAAARFPDQLDDRKIKERASQFRSLDKKKRMAFRNTLVDKTFSVLTEGWAPGNKNLIWGLSDNYVRFSFPSKTLIKNEIVMLKADGVTEDGIIAQRFVV